ncbi:MAG: M81 family metallopeptidase [bacterium]|nr:M81 family metallopeptidase [bacterium]
MRIVVAGFQHETNTFAPTLASFEEFQKRDGWPELLYGDEVLHRMEGLNIPIAGFAEAAKRCTEWTLIPLLWASAEPSSYVTDDAYERIVGSMLHGIRDAGSIDGIYLDLHGAMVVESFQDGEGELLHRIRDLVGPDLPIVISLDLHANTTRAMCDQATAITIFRTYPHLDMAETGARCVPLLNRALAGIPIFKAWRQSPFLIGLSAQHTGSSPCRELYDLAIELSPGNDEGILTTELSLGFPPADIFDSGPALVAYGATQADAELAADTLFNAWCEAEPRFDDMLKDPAEAVRQAMALTEDGGCVVIADAQDNPGAGASSDTVGMLAALLDGEAQQAVVALLDDRSAAQAAHEAGIGAELKLELGGKSGLPGQAPYAATFRVEAIGDGRIHFSGEMYGGMDAEIGVIVLLRVVCDHADVRVVVGSERCQCLDQEIFRHVGIDPAQQRIVVVKSTVHFRADFESIARAVLVAEAPGAHPCRLSEVNYRNLRRGVRLGALGPLSLPQSKA